MNCILLHIPQGYSANLGTMTIPSAPQMLTLIFLETSPQWTKAL